MRAASGTSSRSFWLRAGSITVAMPARVAANTFSGGFTFTGETQNTNSASNTPLTGGLTVSIGTSTSLGTGALDATGHATGIDFHANPGDTYHVHLAYDGTTLTETVTDSTKNVTVSQAYTIDIPGTIGAPCALVGFTGASGGERSEQDILNWTFTSGNTKPTRLPADFNNDGKVDFSDLLILAQNYGQSGKNQNTGDVPSCCTCTPSALASASTSIDGASRSGSTASPRLLVGPR